MTFARPGVGQIVNSLSPDKTGMYYYALDTLTKLIKTEKEIQRLVLRADWSVIQDFPDKIAGISVLKEKDQLKVNEIRETDVVVRIFGLTIIRDQVTISMQPLERRGKSLDPFANRVYVFYFKYLPDSQTYRFDKIKSR